MHEDIYKKVAKKHGLSVQFVRELYLSWSREVLNHINNFDYKNFKEGDRQDIVLPSIGRIVLNVKKVKRRQNEYKENQTAGNNDNNDSGKISKDR